MHAPGSWKEWSDLAQALALGIAALYFSTRLLLGYFMTNLSVEPIVKRQRTKNIENDFLLLTLKLTKGDREGMDLDRVVIAVIDATDGASAVLHNHAYEPRVADTNRALRLSPGETTFFSFHFTVPSESTCQIQVEILGRSGFLQWPKVYWKTLAVSLPIASENGPNLSLNPDASPAALARRPLGAG